MAVANLAIVGDRDTTHSASVWGYQNDGVPAWTYDTGDVTYSVKRDSSGNFYIVGKASGSKNCWKLDSEGNLLDSAYVYNSSYAYDVDVDSNYVYVATNSGGFRLDLNLDNEATIRLTVATQGIAVDPDGNIYLGSVRLYKFNSSLVYQWEENSGDAFLSVAILSNKDIVVGTNDQEVRYYKADGSSPSGGTWAYAFPSSAYARVAVDSQDNVYGVRSNNASGSKERFVQLDIGGNKIVGIDTPSGDLENIFIDENDIVYIVGDYARAFNVFKADLTNQSMDGVFVTPYPTTTWVVRGIAAAPDFSFSVELKDDIQGFWKLNDDAANTTVVDGSGNSRNGTSTKNTSVMNTIGKINDALNFVEADVDEVDCGDIADIDLGPNQDLSIAFWMKWAGSMTGSYSSILHKYERVGDSNGNGFYVRKPSLDGSLDVRLCLGAGVSLTASATGIPTPMTDWVLVVARFDRTGSMWISVNNWDYYGSAVISSQEATDFSNSQSFSIGGLANRDATYKSFNGAIDCVGVWDRLLTSVEETQLWNSGSGTEDWEISVAPTITDQSGDTTLNEGTLLTLFVTATGDPAPDYQWYKDDVLLSGATSSTFSTYVSLSDAGTYKCKVSNLGGEVWSNDMEVTVVANPYRWNPHSLQLDINRTT